MGTASSQADPWAEWSLRDSLHSVLDYHVGCYPQSANEPSQARISSARVREERACDGRKAGSGQEGGDGHGQGSEQDTPMSRTALQEVEGRGSRIHSLLRPKFDTATPRERFIQSGCGASPTCARRQACDCRLVTNRHCPLMEATRKARGGVSNKDARAGGSLAPIARMSRSQRSVCSQV
jgi:hypothetical protein